MSRDAPPEYSTVPFDMEPEILPEGSPVPVNKTGELDSSLSQVSSMFNIEVVKLNPRPWLRAWEQMQGYVHGYELTDVSFISSRD